MPAWKYWKLKSATLSISLEILEIWVFQLPHILEILENGFFQLPHILEIVDRTIHTQSYPGNIGSYNPYISPILEILEISVWIGDMSGCVYNHCFAVEPPRSGFFSAKNNISLIFGHVLSQEIALFLDFGPYLAPIWSLLSLIEPYLNLIGALLSLIGALLEPYWALLSLIEPYWALTVKQ